MIRKKLALRDMLGWANDETQIFMQDLMQADTDGKGVVCSAPSLLKLVAFVHRSG